MESIVKFSNTNIFFNSTVSSCVQKTLLASVALFVGLYVGCEKIYAADTFLSSFDTVATLNVESSLIATVETAASVVLPVKTVLVKDGPGTFWIKTRQGQQISHDATENDGMQGITYLKQGEIRISHPEALGSGFVWDNDLDNDYYFAPDGSSLGLKESFEYVASNSNKILKRKSDGKLFMKNNAAAFVIGNDNNYDLSIDNEVANITTFDVVSGIYLKADLATLSTSSHIYQKAYLNVKKNTDNACVMGPNTSFSAGASMDDPLAVPLAVFNISEPTGTCFVTIDNKGYNMGFSDIVTSPHGMGTQVAFRNSVPNDMIVSPNNTTKIHLHGNCLRPATADHLLIGMGAEVKVSKEEIDLPSIHLEASPGNMMAVFSSSVDIPSLPKIKLLNMIG